MEANYSPNKKKRKFDNYTPGRVPGKRPDHAVNVYSQTIRRLFPESNIILGDLEATIRRLAHYDYWDDKIRKSILLDSKADLIIYGMGEHQVVEVADNLNAGIEAKYLNYLDGTSYKTNDISHLFYNLYHLSSLST